MMEYVMADKTSVDLLGDKPRVTKDDVHNMLMVAGFTPGFGNIADAADAILYAAEGEFGAAGLSAAAIIPFIGQTVSAKRALKIAKESGEKMVTLYRGVDKWHPGRMVRQGKFKGKDRIWAGDIDAGPAAGGEGLYTTTNVNIARDYALSKVNAAKKLLRSGKSSEGILTRAGKKDLEKIINTKEDIILEFEVPESFLKERSVKSRSFGHTTPHSGKTYGLNTGEGDNYIFLEGLPKAFLTKVHK